MECKWCKEIIDESKLSKYASGEFCSKSCANKYSNSFINYDELKQGNCSVCGKEMMIKKNASSKTVKCDDCKRQYKKEYRDERKEKRKIYYENNKPEILKKMKMKEDDEKKHTPKNLEDKYPKNIKDMSSRTTRKVLVRLNLKCCVCGWDEGSCDIHHINGRKIENCDNHDNLTYICPNCHRLVHENKIDKDVLIPLSKYLIENWRKWYYNYNKDLPIETFCPVCGELKIYRQKTCSVKCANILKRKDSKLDKCPVCGEYKPVKQKTCSIICSGYFRSKIDWDSINLEEKLRESNINKISKELGCTFNTVKKRAKKLNLI